MWSVSSDEILVDNQESIKALQDLFEEKSLAPSATVQSLLDETRGQKPMAENSSVYAHYCKDIPCLQNTKWVCLYLVALSGIMYLSKHRKVVLIRVGMISQ